MPVSDAAAVSRSMSTSVPTMSTMSALLLLLSAVSPALAERTLSAG